MALYRCVTLKMPLLRKNINSTFTVCYLHIKIGPRLILQQRLFLLTAKPRNQIPRDKNKKLNMCFFGYLYLIIRQIQSQVFVIT